jgi:cytochrome c-type biogenesis protein CcmE
MLYSNKKRGFAMGAALTAVICLAALSGVIYAFMANASSYVTVAEARASSADRMHLMGDLVQESVHQDLANHTLTFDLKDKTGTMTVVYQGTFPQNLGEAKQVVAIGGMKDGKFESDKLLVKCPSKYESEKKQ